MPPVQQHVLNWLYSVLTSEYHDVNRTYNDVAQALSHYPSLSPRTDVHTFDNGTSALLLHLSGTLPVIFRGATYRFPISICLPYAYPREAPLVYVTPSESMMVRPGQHVDPQGQVYHPYLAGWSTFWDKSTILDFLAILRDVFAKEPPVIARQPPRQSASPAQHPSAQPTPPPVPPPHPPELSGRPVSRTSQVHAQTPPVQPGPPPPPPKQTGHEPPRLASPPSRSTPTTGPPLPPLPPGMARSDSRDVSGSPKPTRPSAQTPSRYDSAPPLPPHPQQPPPPQLPQQQQPPISTAFQYQHPQPPGQPPVHLDNPPYHQQIPFTQPSPFPHPDPRQVQGGPPPGWQPADSRSQAQSAAQIPPPQQQPKPKLPPPDLLDEPLSLSIPTPSELPGPPIPPNPEKDALLRQLGQALHAYRQRGLQQNESSMAGLRAQHAAMLAAKERMEAEQVSLDHLSALLSSNANILHDALRKADAVIEASRNQRPPDIDELLVAPTVVANQLYNLVAEERAIGDTIFVLGRAVERGRVSPAVFAKTTRSLAREWYLKKALARKIARGMGLTV
ncbi:UEV-domain-containing protein [Sodiomyces alkalinus F11]|uniref:UEV-domain-containing protein n=1 Tax=Sodiomyces alkalinus (strain CBS 110278 / VKM F-3762 / F11) TaxID=1314773 RepID=A0A3N2Q2S8_SODAK|nr:UEV-domain-containing protein [Sodiomyces alkalinus F11]ROT40925.1 UEV-domain-containing protein [Sodiomyces alkalinus F11]